MKSSSLIAVLLCLMVLIPVRPAEAQSLFYEGDVVVESISSTITLSEEAVVESAYVLHNKGGQEEQLSVQLADPDARDGLVYFVVEDPLILQPGERKTLLSKYILPLPEEDFQTLAYHLALNFNDLPLAESPIHMETEVILPEGVSRLTAANKDFIGPEVDDQGRSHLFRQVQNRFPTRTTLKWNRLGLDLRVGKSVQPQKITEADQTLEVEIVVENMGQVLLESLLVQDSFSPSTYQGVSPEEAFTLTDPEVSDPRLLWQAEVPSLEVGETRSFTYTVRYVGDVRQIYDLEVDPAVVLWGGQAVALSNPVRVGLVVGAEVVQPDQGRGFLYSNAFRNVMIGAAAVLLAAAVVIFVLVGKRFRKGS
jgi:hypothetical protein